MPQWGKGIFSSAPLHCIVHTTLPLGNIPEILSTPDWKHFWTATLLNELTLKLGLHAVKVQANLCDHRGIKQNSQNFFIDH